MNATNETVREVCASLHRVCNSYLENYADRILAAYEREMKAIRQCLTGDCERFKLGAEPCTTCTVYSYEREMAAKDAEIAKHERCYHSLEVHCKKLEDEYLRATNALKPVMECDLGSPNQMAAWGAVREAQRIYKKGEEK